MKSKRRVNQALKEQAIKIFRGVRGKLSNPQIAKKLDISLRRVSQLKKEFRQTGKIKQTIKNNHSSKFRSNREKEFNQICNLVERYPQASLSEISDRLVAQGLSVSPRTLSKQVNKLKLQGKIRSQRHQSKNYCLTESKKFKDQSQQQKIKNQQMCLLQMIKMADRNSKTVFDVSKMSQAELINYAATYRQIAKKALKLSNLADLQLKFKYYLVNQQTTQTQNLKKQEEQSYQTLI